MGVHGTAVTTGGLRPVSMLAGAMQGCCTGPEGVHMLAGAAQGCCTGPETGEHAGKGCSGLLRMVPRECACSRGAAQDLRIDQIEQMPTCTSIPPLQI